MTSSTADIITLFKKLMTVNDVPKIVQELESYNGENSKYFKTLIQNLGTDLSKYKYVFDLVLKINKESPKVTFHDIYFKYLSTNNFQKFRNFFVFVNKLVLDDSSHVDSLVNDDDVDIQFDMYNTIVSSLDKETGIKLIKDFLTQRTLTFEEYYNQKYLSNTEKLKSKLENTYLDINKLYYRYPWLSEYIVSKVYISSTDHDIDVFIENPLTPTIFKSKTWYKPNSLFYSFLANQSNSRKIKSSDNGLATLEFFDDKSREVTFSFHIMYKLFKNDFSFTYLIFDESVYNLERKFLTVDYDTVCDEYHINMFLDDPEMFNQVTIDLMLEFFNKAMSNVQSKYKINDSILKKIPSMKSIRTLRELARKIAEVTIFVHMDSISESIFKKQIIRNYYKADVLFDLEIEEKLPELLYDIENVDNITDYLENSIENEIYNIGESVYRLSRKIVFKQQQRKRTHAPLIKLRYIDEDDNHNYIYYDKKEKWLNIKDVLNKKFDDDEYILDVIYPRVCEIFNREEVLKPSLSDKEFKNKYKLLLTILDHVISEEELLEKHRNMFLFFPDPKYDGVSVVVLEEESIPIPSLELLPQTPVPLPPPAIQLPRLDIFEETPPQTPPPQTPPQTPPPAIKSSSLPQDYNFDDIVIAPPPPVQSPTYDDNDPDKCSRCDKTSFHECTLTYLHSKDNIKSVRCVTMCFNCLEKYTLTDD